MRHYLVVTQSILFESRTDALNYWEEEKEEEERRKGSGPQGGSAWKDSNVYKVVPKSLNTFFFFVLFCCFALLDRVAQADLSTPCVVENGLDPPASTFQVLGLQVGTMMPSDSTVVCLSLSIVYADV
jgi:hypothetical protein